jgi:glycosyltransferase involved in cell wall biosynthesis
MPIVERVCPRFRPSDWLAWKTWLRNWTRPARTHASRRILYVQYTDPAGYPPLEHSSRILADAGWQVLFLGICAFGARTLRFPPHRRIRVRQLAYCPEGWRQKLHYAWFTLWVVGWVLYWRPGWLYASDLLACPAGLLASFIPGIKVVFHEHDSPGRSPVGRFLTICRLSRRLLARRMTVGVLPNESRIDAFRVDLGPCRDVVCVWNTPSIVETPDTQERKDHPYPRLYYHGNISAQLLPIAVVEAIALLPNHPSLTVVGYETRGNEGYVEELRQRARRLGIGEHFHVVPAMPRFDLLVQCRSHDIGLALFAPTDANVNLTFLVGASNKPFDYLACGLAVLVPDLLDWRRTYVDPGYGLACDPRDAKSIAAALVWFVEHPKETRMMGEAGRSKIRADWNYEKSFDPIRRVLESQR